MTPRERKLALIVLGVILVGGGGTLGYMFVYQPLQQKKATAGQLQTEVDDLESKVGGLVRARPQIAEAKRQSLPADVSVAKTQYQLLVERLLLQVGIKQSHFKISDGKVLESRKPVVPEVADKKPAYTRLEFTITVTDATALQLAEFLQNYYRLDLLHQITGLTITRENKVAESRAGLKAVVTSEAVILDGAENRTTLFPVSSAVAAVAGLPGLMAVTLVPETTRRLAPATATPVLAARGRDYSFLARNDMFYGPLQDTPPVPFDIAGRFPDVELEYGKRSPEVRVRLSGESTAGAKVTATAVGNLLPPGEVKVDQRALTFTVPTPKDDHDPYSTSTVTVVAVSADGKTRKEKAFKVSVARPTPPPPEAPKDDIASAIKLIGVTGRSDGTVTAIIYDAANPYRYDIVATPKGIDVSKIWQSAGKTWRKDRDYDHPPAVLAISDDNSATKRTFRVVALERDAVVVADIGKPDAARADAPRPIGKGIGGPGVVRPSTVSRQGPADPLAAVAGNAAAAAKAATPVLYRWATGKSLHDVVSKPENRVSAAEAKKILQQTTVGGPLTAFATAPVPPGN